MTRLAFTASYRLGHAPTPSAAHADRGATMLRAGVAGLAVLGLLALFQSVVSDSVHQGRLRHEATARHSAASWRCTGMASLRLRDDCLAALNAVPPQASQPSTP